MTLLPDDFRDLLVELCDAGSRFVIVGGYAVAFHGHVRATKDLGVRVLDALRAFGAPLGALGVTLEDFTVPGRILQLGLPPLRVDLLTSIPGVSFAEAVAGGDELVVVGRRAPVIGRAALLVNKRATGRPQDLADVAALSGG